MINLEIIHYFLEKLGCNLFLPLGHGHPGVSPHPSTGMGMCERSVDCHFPDISDNPTKLNCSYTIGWCSLRDLQDQNCILLTCLCCLRAYTGGENFIHGTVRCLDLCRLLLHHLLRMISGSIGAVPLEKASLVICQRHTARGSAAWWAQELPALGQSFPAWYTPEDTGSRDMPHRLEHARGCRHYRTVACVP